MESRDWRSSDVERFGPNLVSVAKKRPAILPTSVEKDNLAERHVTSMLSTSLNSVVTCKDDEAVLDSV